MSAQSLIAYHLANENEGQAVEHKKSPVLNPLERLKLFKARRRKALQYIQALPILPPGQHEFSETFFKNLFQRSKQQGYSDNQQGALHISTFRKFMWRLFFVAEMQVDYRDVHQAKFDAYVGSTTWLKFESLHQACEQGLKIVIPLRFMERLNLVFEDSKSVAGLLWHAILFAAIFTSMWAVCTEGEEEDETVSNVLLYVFSAEYFIKLACAPFCRRSLLDVDKTIIDMVPQGHDPNARLPILDSKMARLCAFLTRPMNVMDFLAIAPFWAEIAEEYMGGDSANMSKQFVLLRAFRVARVLKIAKYSSHFELMGTVFAKSASSIAVIFFTLVLLSLILGAITFQLEQSLVEKDPDSAVWIGNGEFHDVVQSVPRAMLWTIGRLTNMQGSLSSKYAIPADFFNQLIMYAVGLLKGFVFLLPLGQIQLLYKDAIDEYKRKEDLDRQVNMDTLTLGHPWLLDLNSPFVHIEIFSCDDPDQRVGCAFLSLPISTHEHLKPTPTMTEVTGLQGHKIYKYPAIYIEVEWIPSQHDQDWLPDGQLTLRLMSGNNFPKDGRWFVRIKVPEKMHADYYWQSQPSSMPDSDGRPRWDEVKSFDIKWKQIEDRRQKDFKVAICQLLEKQLDQLERLLPPAKTQKLQCNDAPG